MESSNKQRYLGDLYSTDCKIDENIQMRYNKGIGIVNNILIILKHISFGHFSIEIALILRNSLLLNGILYNVEALVKLEQKHIKILEDCDNYFWQQVFNTPRTTAMESYHIEASTMPLRFTILGRKFMFLWTLLNKSSEELAKRVFTAQTMIKTENSWVDTIEKDLVRCKIDLNFNQISRYSKQQFKLLVKKKLFECSQKFLYDLQQKHSKTQNLVLSDKIKKYLISPNIPLVLKQTIFKLKSRMEHVKNNYKSMYSNDLTCLFCGDPGSVDCLEHYLETCLNFKTDPRFRSKIRNVKYVDLFRDVDAQVKVAKIWMEIEEQRKLLQNARPEV